MELSKVLFYSTKLHLTKSFLRTLILFDFANLVSVGRRLIPLIGQLDSIGWNWWRLRLLKNHETWWRLPRLWHDGVQVDGFVSSELRGTTCEACTKWPLIDVGLMTANTFCWTASAVSLLAIKQVGSMWASGELRQKKLFHLRCTVQILSVKYEQ